MHSNYVGWGEQREPQQIWSTCGVGIHCVHRQPTIVEFIYALCLKGLPSPFLAVPWLIAAR